MKRLVANVSVNGKDLMSYIAHKESDVKAHHDFVRFRKALHALAKELDGGQSSDFDNSVTLGFWKDLTRIDLCFEIENVKFPVA